MPRPNKNRTIAAEDNLAARIAYERNQRGWTCEALAAAMTEAGCSIKASAIWKIEKGEPRRRVTVDELAALSIVWAISMDRLCAFQPFPSRPPVASLDD